MRWCADENRSKKGRIPFPFPQMSGGTLRSRPQLDNAWGDLAYVASNEETQRKRMSGLRIYGIARTRAFRALWVAKELGLDYEHLPIEIGDAGGRKSTRLNSSHHD